ncbi:MAG: hypothetical protein RLZZ116_2130 [Planctomycetota bacterium]|jgi:hypothetical protein
MLDQTHTPFDPSDPAAAPRADGSVPSPLSVPAPRASASAVVPNAQSRSADRLSEMVARAELLLLHLESRLHDERAASERAARATSEMEERLRLGVRMLQAIDVQVERGEQASAQAQELLVRAESHARESAQGAQNAIKELAEGVIREKFEWIERELAWRFERVKEIEERIEHAANSKLAWLDGELGQRIARIDDACANASTAITRAESALERLGQASALVERAERIGDLLVTANESSSRNIESLAMRIHEATELRESIGGVTADVAAAREVVDGELRRMRDDLFWLTDRGERISAELVERADGAAVCMQALRVQTEAAAPVLNDLAAWMPLLAGEHRERLRPLADAVASRVRDNLATDMRGFSTALRQLADRAEGAFTNVKLDPALVEVDARSIARTFATELSRLAPMPKVPSEGLASHSQPSQQAEAPVISANQPIELTV